MTKQTTIVVNGSLRVKTDQIVWMGRLSWVFTGCMWYGKFSHIPIHVVIIMIHRILIVEFFWKVAPPTGRGTYIVLFLVHIVFGAVHNISQSWAIIFGLLYITGSYSHSDLLFCSIKATTKFVKFQIYWEFLKILEIEIELDGQKNLSAIFIYLRYQASQMTTWLYINAQHNVLKHGAQSKRLQA